MTINNDMAKRKEPRYRIVVKYETDNKAIKTIDKDDEGRPLTEDTWEAEYEYWQAEQSIWQYETNIEWVRAYKGNRRIA